MPGGPPVAPASARRIAAARVAQRPAVQRTALALRLVHICYE